jgi:hypothetical protein
MNSHLFKFTSTERALWLNSELDPTLNHQLAHCSSSLSQSTPENQRNIFFHTSPVLQPFSTLPRFFARGALDHDRKRNPTPLFQLLTIVQESTRPRPLPHNRLLLKTLCRGVGTLRQNSQGHVYLDLDNQFILALLPYLKSQGLIRPPYFNLFGAPDGAHIPTIPSREMFFQDLGVIKELGQQFNFEIEGLYSISSPTAWPEVEEVWFFKVKSQELEKLRRRYFLPNLPSGHPFIIAIAIKPKQNKNTASSLFHLISPSVTAA